MQIVSRLLFPTYMSDIILDRFVIYRQRVICWQDAQCPEFSMRVLYISHYFCKEPYIMIISSHHSTIYVVKVYVYSVKFWLYCKCTQRPFGTERTMSFSNNMIVASAGEWLMHQNQPKLLVPGSRPAAVHSTPKNNRRHMLYVSGWNLKLAKSGHKTMLPINHPTNNIIDYGQFVIYS